MQQPNPGTPRDGRSSQRGRGSAGRVDGGRGMPSPPAGRGPPPPAQQQQQQPQAIHTQSGLPFGHVPAYLPGSSSLVEELDQRLLIILRDGKHLVGVSSYFLPKDSCEMLLRTLGQCEQEYRRHNLPPHCYPASWIDFD